MFRLGLTGGIGSGKSTAAHILTSIGAEIIDADAISRRLTASGGEAVAALSREFGAQAIDSTGAMDRTFMRNLAFSDPLAKAKLEAIIHPMVRAISREQIARCQASLLVHDIPLLIESRRSRGQFDAILVIDCAVSTQIERVLSRSGGDSAGVERIIAAQASREARRQCADYVIFNDGISLDDLKFQLATLVKTLDTRAQPL